MNDVFGAAASNALAATALALLAAAVGRLGGHPALVHRLWLLVLLKLITPPLLGVPLAWPMGPGAAVDRGELATSSAGRAAGASLAIGGDAPTVGPITSGPKRPDLAPSWVSIAWAVWLAGSGTWMTLVGVRIARFRLLLRFALPAPDELSDRVEALSRRLGLARCPAVLLAPGPIPPMVWGLGRAPRLLIPADLWSRLGEEQRSTLLVHELAHLKRGDHWVRGLELVVTSVYWWHPVVWWALAELREAEEQCCDAWVVQDSPGAAPTYAATLLETARFLSGFRPPAAPPAVSGMSQFSSLKRRLLMITQRRIPGRSMSRLGEAGVLALASLALAVGPSAGRAQQPAPSRGTPSMANFLLVNADDGRRIRVEVRDGVVTRATVDGAEVPTDRVRLVGKGLVVVDEGDRVIGSMANRPGTGPGKLKDPAGEKPAARGSVPVGEDNPGLKVEIKDSRFLVATVDGAPIPAGRIRLEGGSIKIYDENGDVLRVIVAEEGPARSAPGDDLAGVLARDGRFGTLIAALEGADLLGTLRTEGPFTVLAPTDEAFARLPGPLRASLLKPEGRDKLRGLLTYHVIPGKVSSRELAAGDGGKALSGGRLRFGIEGGRLAINRSRVVSNDIPASNGLVHAIDAVLSPE